MKSNVQRLPVAPRRRAKTLGGWALSLLMEYHAITECQFHGHRKDRGDSEALIRAREHAWSDPYPGTTPEEAVAAINDVMSGIGDTCPECH
jgi:hypothetical protein